jgi:lysophospholipase L1-like esterase
MHKILFTKTMRNYSIVFSVIALLAVSLWVFRTIKHLGESKSHNQLVILCAGDSLTAGSYPDWLQRKCDEEKRNVIVINKGVKGHTSKEYLLYMEQQNILEACDPDIILLQLGTNDVRIDADNTPTDKFVENMNEIIQKMSLYKNSKGSNPKILISTILPIKTVYSTFNQESNKRVVEEINPAIKRLADKWNLLFVDNYQLFVDNKELLPDIHPNEHGYRVMAENWYKTLVSVFHDEMISRCDNENDALVIEKRVYAT